MAPITELAARAEHLGVCDERVIAAMRSVPRAPFVPRRWRWSADQDRPLPIGDGQTMSQPSLIAAMIDAAAIGSHDRVLEVGTGTGYQTALLRQITDDVVTIDVRAGLAERARANLDQVGVADVEIYVGDGRLGVPDRAPFDAIIVSAASPAVPAELATQLAEGGRLVIPLGPGGDEDVLVFVRDGERIARMRTLTAARFVPLTAGVREMSPMPVH